MLLLYSKWVLRHKYKHRERGDAKVDLLRSLKGDDKSSNRKKAAKIEGKRLMLLCEKKKSGKKFSAIIATQANLSAILNIY